jgi:hypothetical protein
MDLNNLQAAYLDRIAKDAVTLRIPCGQDALSLR